MIKQVAKVAVIGTLMFSGTLFAMDYAFSIPIVNKSFSTNQCVSVDNYPGLVFGKAVYSCENMPEKYELNWVK
jgi:hypothetical protein